MITIIFFSCSPSYMKHVSEYATADRNGTGVPDYHNLYYWAAHPFKHSLSDSIPAPLKSGFIKDQRVDVFFLHPTSYGSRSEPELNAPIDDPIVNARTDYSSIL